METTGYRDELRARAATMWRHNILDAGLRSWRGESIASIARRLGVSRSTAANYAATGRSLWQSDPEAARTALGAYFAAVLPVDQAAAMAVRVSAPVLRIIEAARDGETGA